MTTSVSNGSVLQKAERHIQVTFTTYKQRQNVQQHEAAVYSSCFDVVTQLTKSIAIDSQCISAHVRVSKGLVSNCIPCLFSPDYIHSIYSVFPMFILSISTIGTSSQS